MKNTELSEKIKTLYKEPISDQEAEEAAHNLLGFFELLIEFNNSQKQK